MVGEAAEKSKGDSNFNENIDAELSKVLNEGFKKLNPKAKKCLNFHDASEAGDSDKRLFVEDGSLTHPDLESSSGYGYIRAAREFAVISDKNCHKYLAECYKTKDQTETYDFKTLLKEWREQSELAKWLAKLRLHVPNQKKGKKGK